MKSFIAIADYDPKWPIMYEEEKAKILSVIGHKVVAIEHIGSTAVPNLGAKPIIDIMVAVRHLSDAEECIEPLKSIGYEYVPENEISIPERRYFQKGTSEAPNQHSHLHMVERTSDFWQRQLLFRDYLRAHPDVANQYCQLKKKLATKHGSNREAYTDAKTSFIKSVVDQARVSKSKNSQKMRRNNV